MQTDTSFRLVWTSCGPALKVFLSFPLITPSYPCLPLAPQLAGPSAVLGQFLTGCIQCFPELNLERLSSKLSWFCYLGFRAALKALELAQLRQEPGARTSRQRRELRRAGQVLQLALPPEWVSCENMTLVSSFA